MRHRRSHKYETRRARQGLLFDTKSRKIAEIRRSAGAGGLNGRYPAPGILVGTTAIGAKRPFGLSRLTKFG
jgi:hypothetical protein